MGFSFNIKNANKSVVNIPINDNKIDTDNPKWEITTIDKYQEAHHKIHAIPLII